MDPKKRQQRHRRIRARVQGTTSRPRVCIYRSARYVEAQLINDETRITICSVHGKTVKATSKITQAEQVGKELAAKAKKAGATAVVFDRSGYKYHGRVKAVVDGLRAGGLNV